MAGIGFHLHKLVSGDTYTQAATGYLSSIVITSGPWLTSVISLSLLSAIGIPSFTAAQYALVMATITYAFCASLILTGGPQMVISRYLADRLYVEDWASIAPTCNGVLLLVAPLFAVAAPFLLFAPFAWHYRLLAVTLFLVLCLLWLTSIFLSAARDYLRIVVVFAIGHTVSIAAAMALGRAGGVVGALAGYTLGQATSVALFIAQIFQEFGVADRIDGAYLRYFGRYWDLLLLGFLYTAGIWADNIVRWFTAGSHAVAGFYRINSAYDLTKLLAYLTTILAATMFIVHIETGFARHYWAFYHRIETSGTLAEIGAAKRGMIASVRAGLANVLKMQLIVVGAALLLAPEIVGAVGLSAGDVPLLRRNLLGANMQFVVQLIMLLLLYLDQRRRALRVIALFMAVNIVSTLAVTWFAPAWDGTGFLIAATLAATFALGTLRDVLRRLEYLTFMLQPLAQAAPLALSRRGFRLGSRWNARPRRRRAGDPALPKRA